MLEFQQKRKIRRILYSPVALILLAIVAVLFMKGAWNVYQKEAASRDYLDQAQDQLTNVSANEKSLSASVAALQTQQGIDADIRQKFHVVKPGEQIAVIVDDASTSDEATTTPPSAWQRFIGFFGF